MIRLQTILAIARAEMRLTRRLVRYWVFVSLAVLVGAVAFAYYGLLHYFVSAFSATAAVINPRYLVGAISLYYQAFYLIGLVFLGYDVRARDKRERMHEVLDSLPCSNLELVLGKFLGILIPSWVPLGLLALGFVITGWITGVSIEPYSLVTFVTFMIVPAFVFTLGLVFLGSLLLRHRGIAAVVLLAVLGGLVTGMVLSPVWLGPVFDIMGLSVFQFPSDITPMLMDGEGWLHQLGVLCCGVGLLFFAAAVHPRKDDSSLAGTAGTGLVTFLIGVSLMGSCVLVRHGALNQAAEWRQAHEQRRDDPAPDIDAMNGSVRVDPGRSLQVDLEIVFHAPEGSGLDTALFTLNPGYEVDGVSDAGGDLDYTFDKGFLEVTLPAGLDPGASRTISMQFHGSPDANFAYLDAAMNFQELSGRDNQMFLLGDLPHIFDPRYVALMPGVRWLPAAGAEIGRNDPTIRPVDFFKLDLSIDLPLGWTAVAAGKRREQDGAGEGRALYRFTPSAPVPEVALVASRFQAYTAEIGGVHAELLLHESHLDNIEVFSDTGGKILEYIEEKLNNGSEVGLDYPYESLSMVEVPNRLRGFAGGWRLDTTLAPPSMVMVRESSFPTAQFAMHFKDASEFEDTDGGVSQAKLDYLIRFFDNDFSGGNPFIGSTRNFFGNQTAPRGPEGIPLDFVFEDLSRRLIVDRQAYFSAFLFDRDMGQTISQSLGQFFSSGGQGDFVDTLTEAATSRTAVWDRVLDVSLADMDPWEDPAATIDVLTLKGGAMSRSMLDELGREETGKFMAALRARKQGSSFTREDLLEAGKETGVDLESWLDVWIDNTDLPGFLVTETDAYRLEDTEDGSPRYQARVTIVNEERVPGLVRVDYRILRAGGEPDIGTSGPVRIPPGGAVEIGMVASAAPRALSIVPYLSLNRGKFVARLPDVDEESSRDDDPFRGVREVEWQEPDTGIVVVDDLDEGFSVEESGGGSGLRIAGKKSEDEETDQGLPVFQFNQRSTRWSRFANQNAYGKYRHTLAVIRAGKGDRHAVFTALIPSGGSWDLELHMPETRGLFFMSGIEDWHLAIEDGGVSHEATFDAAAGESGWNNVGSYDLTGGEVVVRLSDKSEGRVVVADAIRWVPSSDAARAEKAGS